MASSKLKIKPIDRDALYFNKYLYRAYIKAPNLYWVQYCKDIDEYSQRITAEGEEWEIAKKNPNSYWYPHRYSPDPIDFDLVTHIIDLRIKYYRNKLIGMRHEGNTISVYTNDVKMLEGIVKVKPNVKLSQAIIAPKGIKYFKKEPPAKYRAYMSNNKMPADFKTDLIEYLERTPDICPSKSFEHFLSRRVNHNYSVWLWSNYFVDYNDERNLMMMHLMFPGAIGKTYKLEKK
jgi:hypothetical protein